MGDHFVGEARGRGKAETDGEARFLGASPWREAKEVASAAETS